MSSTPTNSNDDSLPTPTTPEGEEHKDAPVSSDPTPRIRAFLPGEPVQIRTKSGWRNARYQAYFPQYEYHGARLSDGTTWTGTTDEIRIPGEDAK